MSKEPPILQSQNLNGKRVPTSPLGGSPSLKRPYLDVPTKTITSSYISENEDLTFLDDLDVDEIAACLNNCEDISSAQISNVSCADANINKNEDLQGNQEKKINQNNHSQVIKLKQNDNDNKTKIENSHKKKEKEINNGFKASLKKVKLSKSDKRLAFKVMKRIHRNFKEEYAITSLICNGKYSKIFRCRDVAGKQYAVKVLNKGADTKNLSKEKENLLLQIQSDIPERQYFLVSFKAGFSFRGSWCFFMEFYPKTLKNVLDELCDPFHINIVQEFARQLVDAVTVLSYNNIIHSDIKPSHILMNSSNKILKLCGFDDAYYMEPTHVSSNIGSLNYRPPEIILGHSSGLSIDVWSTGTVLHEIATNRKLFPGSSNNDILYEQMCLLGDFPDTMLEKSSKIKKYFRGNMFIRNSSSIDQMATLMDRSQFYNTNSIAKTVFNTYYQYHAENLPSSKERKKYKNKLNSFLKLIEQMLVLCPEDRVTMEVAYTDSFIYESYDKLLRSINKEYYCNTSKTKDKDSPSKDNCTNDIKEPAYMHHMFFTSTRSQLSPFSFSTSANPSDFCYSIPFL